MASPMTANSTSCVASAPIVAPTSSTTLSLRSVGHMAAIAGREIPGLTQGLARLGIHAHGHVRMTDLDTVPEPGVTLQKGRDAAAVPDQEEAEFRMADRGERRAGNHDVGSGIAAHRVQRDGQMFVVFQSSADNRPTHLTRLAKPGKA